MTKPSGPARREPASIVPEATAAGRVRGMAGFRSCWNHLPSAASIESTAQLLQPERSERQPGPGSRCHGNGQAPAPRVGRTFAELRLTPAVPVVTDDDVCSDCNGGFPAPLPFRFCVATGTSGAGRARCWRTYRRLVPAPGPLQRRFSTTEAKPLVECLRDSYSERRSSVDAPYLRVDSPDPESVWRDSSCVARPD
jgi:hypothetical protein